MAKIFNMLRETAASVEADDSTDTFIMTMRVINAALTFLFGYQFGGDFFPTGFPQLSAGIGGLAFAAIYDYGAYGWDSAGKRSGLSIRQMNIAFKMSRASMVSSTLLSVAFLMLTTSLVDLSSIHDTIGLVSVMGTGALLALHFINIFRYKWSSPEETKAKATAQRRARMYATQQNRQDKIMDQMEAKIDERMVAHVDRFAEIEAAKEWDRFLSDRGYSGAAAGAKQVGGGGTTPPSGHEDAIIDNEPAADQDPLDLAELRGNAQAAQENNLNMAAG